MSGAGAAAGTLTQAYEALRAQATGQLPTTTPRGLALFLARGTPAWIAAWTPLALPPAALARPHPSVAPAPAEALVQVLTAMALGGQTRGAA